MNILPLNRKKGNKKSNVISEKNYSNLPTNPEIGSTMENDCKMDGVFAFIFAGNGPAIGTDDRPRCRESDSVSGDVTVAGGVGTEKTLKKAIRLAFRQVVTPIDRFKDRIAVSGICMDLHGRPIHGVFNRIIQNNRQQLFDLRAAAADRHTIFNMLK